MKSGPIIIIDDDPDDKSLLEDILKNELQVTNELTWFGDAIAALVYLQTTAERPFLIFCDVNLPKLSGIEFKRMIDGDRLLRKKSIPFIFYSTSVAQHSVDLAYSEMTVQGFFLKQNSFEEITENMRVIIEYWSACRHANTDSGN